MYQENRVEKLRCWEKYWIDNINLKSVAGKLSDPCLSASSHLGRIQISKYYLLRLRGGDWWLIYFILLYLKIPCTIYKKVWSFKATISFVLFLLELMTPSPECDWRPRHVDVSDNLRKGNLYNDKCYNNWSDHCCCPDIVCCDGPVEEGDDDLLRDVRGDGGHLGHSRGGVGGAQRSGLGS